MTDQHLVSLAAAGDPAAQRALYDAHVDRAYGLAYRMTGDEALAQDFTQDAFIRAFERLSGFRGESSFGTWLHSIVVSVTLNGLKRVQRRSRREAPLDDGLEVGTATRHAEPDLRERLERAIDALSDGYRTVFLMHDVEGFTHQEIADALGIQPGTSKAQLFSARRKLRAMLADFAGEWVS